MSKPGRVVSWVAVIILVVAVGLFGELVRETAQMPPTLLLGCADGEGAVQSWTCRQVLLHRTFTAEEVAELNRGGAAAYPMAVKDPALAKEMLSLLLSRGVDINAGDEYSRGGWTALDQMVSSGDLDRVKLLLQHGAQVDVKNKAGVSALDLARRWQQRYPDQSNRAEIVKVLEAAGKPSGTQG
jgi:ankyrin repeat protein